MNLKGILITSQILSIGILGNAAQETTQPPQTLAKWDLICFCSARFFTPQPIVEMGNNGEILYQARSGITRANLKRKGIPFSERQLKVLDACGLLDSGPILRTSIPVLGPSEIQNIRFELNKQAQSNGPILKKKVQKLVEELNHQGFSDNSYSIIFSYLLDGLVWDHLEKQGLMPKNETTTDKPFWDGTFYAVYPIRTGKPGTNTTSDHSWSISLTWTDSVLKASASSGFSKSTKSLLSEIVTNGSVKNPVLIHELQTHGLINPSGHLIVPIIHEKNDDPIYAPAIAISQEIADEMVKIVKIPKFRQLLKTTNSANALVITYHEYLWELLAYLESEGVINKPPALRVDEPVKASDLHTLVYLVEGTH